MPYLFFDPDGIKTSKSFHGAGGAGRVDLIISWLS